jgi:type I restriction enzyme, S subunit
MQTNSDISLVRFSNLNNWSVQYFLDSNFKYNGKYPLVNLTDFLKREKTPIDIENNEKYKRVTIKINNGGVFLRDIEYGRNIGTKRQYLAEEGQFILSKIDARNGAIGIVPKELNHSIVTNDFPLYSINNKMVLKDYLVLITTTKQFIHLLQSNSSGTTNRQRIDMDMFIALSIPLPSIKDQLLIVDQYNEKIKIANYAKHEVENIKKKIETYLFHELGITFQENNNVTSSLHFISFKNTHEWGVDKQNLIGIKRNELKYKLIILNSNICNDVFRGKCPKYKTNSNKIILNQKCNRWNSIELEYAKTVDEEWYDSIQRKFFTHIGDILINSTGEGTLGRASCITKEYVNYIYDTHILLLRLNTSIINPFFFTLFFNSCLGQKQVNEIKSALSTKQTELGVGNLMKIQIPLPPLNIQDKIVKYVKNLEEEIKKLEDKAIKMKKQAINDFENKIFK